MPVRSRLGPEGGGWEVLGRSLVVERHLEFTPGRLRRDVDEIVGWTRDLGLFDQPTVRATLADLIVGLREVEALSLGVLAEIEAGRAATVEAGVRQARRERAGPEGGPGGA